MSIHPSLNLSEKDKKPRSVLKRTERLKAMSDKGAWKEGDEVYGLPKIKTVRIKIKKEKAVEKPEAAAATTAEGQAPGAAGKAPATKAPAAGAGKEATPAKAKAQDKK